MGRMIGIDLGTTHCLDAVIEGGQPRVIPSREGTRTTPAIVGFSAGREPNRGRERRGGWPRPAPRAPCSQSCGSWGASSIAARCRRPAAGCRFGLAAAPERRLRVVIDGEAFSPPEIAALLLRELKAAAEEHLGEAVGEAVVSVPSSFNDLQRQATRDAGTHRRAARSARLVNGSTAAALSLRGSESGRSQRLRGGLRPRRGHARRVDRGAGRRARPGPRDGGRASLGGEDFDRRIVEWLTGELRSQAGGELES